MKKIGKKKLAIAGSCAVITVVILACLFISTNLNEGKINRLLDLGQKYLEDMEYEEAVATFDQVIAIDPKCEQAYMGKAEAQYLSGNYEDAIATLKEGIGRVEDSTKLEEFLQRILNELSEEIPLEVENGIVESESSGEESEPLQLNYTKITRSVDTEDPVIQLEVLGGDSGEHYKWTSSNPDCATVSDTGVVTCLPERSSSFITVRDNKGREDICWVYIFDSNQMYEKESETVRALDENNEYFQVSLFEKEGQKKAEIANDSVDNYVYYSGDISIPERLNYKGEEIQITGIAGGAFSWCNTMESIFIPASIENPLNDMYRGNPFTLCLELKEITVDEKNPFLKSVDGVLYSNDGKKLISYPAAKDGSTYVIPKEVEEVCGGAFVGCKNLEEIQVESGNMNYESIEGVLVSKGWLIAYPIGKKVSSYEVPENITVISGNAFYMSELEEVKCGNVENISSESFGQSSKLKKIEGSSATKSISISMKELHCSNGLEITGIESMENLEYLWLRIFEDYDVNKIVDVEKVKKLKKLETYGVDRIYD